MSNGPPFRPITPQRQLDSREFGRMAEHTELQGQWLAGGNISLIQTGAGTSIISRSGGGGSSKIPARLIARRTSLGPPFPYSWIEQQEIGPLRPGEWEDRPGGLVGTFTVDPAYDLDADQDSQAFDFTGDIVWLWLADFGVWYWFDGDEAGGTGPTGGDRFAKNLSSFPNANGRYEARLMTESTAGGPLTDPDPGGPGNVWLRDANNLPALHVDVIYKAKKTGFADGRDVYTARDFVLRVTDDLGSRGLLGVHNLVFTPFYAYGITASLPRTLLVSRLFDVLLSDVPKQSNVWQENFYPSENHWIITTPGPGRVTIDRNLIVRRQFESFVGQSIWQMIFAPGSPNLMWTVTQDGLGTVTIIRELNYRNVGVLVQARVWDVNFAPANNWVMFGDGTGGVTVQRQLENRLGNAPGQVDLITSFVWRQDFGPSRAHWNIVERAPGHTEIDRVLFVRRQDENIIAGMSIYDIRLDPAGGGNESWEVIRNGVGLAQVRRRWVARHNLNDPINDIWHMTFRDTAPLYADWNIINDADSGRVIVELAGLTVDVPVYRYRCVNEELVEYSGLMRFQRGSLKAWTGYVGYP